MKRTTTRLLKAWLFLLIVLWRPYAFAQTQPSITENDKKNITAKAGQLVAKLNRFLNELMEDDLEKLDADQLIKTGYEVNSEQVFYNGQVRIEDDINPLHSSARNTDDADVDRYLHDLYLYYSKRKVKDPPTIVFANPRFQPVQQTSNSIYIKGYFTSTFKGKHISGKPYQPNERVVEMRAEKPGKWWVVYITRLAFVQPGEGMEQVSQLKNAGRPTIPTNLSINSAEIPYRQPDDNQVVMVKFDSKWLEVVKSEAADMPLGFYQRTTSFYAFDDRYSIEFVEKSNNNRFIFRKGLEYRGFEAVNPIGVKPTKRDSVAKPSLPLAKTKPVARPDTIRRVAVQQPKLEAKPNIPPSVPSTVLKTDSTKSISFNQEKIASKSTVKLPLDRVLKQRTDTASTGGLAQAPTVAPKTIEKTKPTIETPPSAQTVTAAVLPKATARPDTSRKIAFKPPVQPKEESKPGSSIIMPDYKIVSKPQAGMTRDLANKLPPEQIPNAQKEKPIVALPESKTLGSTLVNALDAEAKKQKARYRTQGWLQIVAGVAGLAGSYVGYSSTKKDYDSYIAKVDKLNAEYSSWLAVARNPSGEPMTPMSITSYGKPGIYGAYAGGAISVGAVINGIRLLGKAGKVKSKSVKK